jgi:hypothetical protein
MVTPSRVAKSCSATRMAAYYQREADRHIYQPL